MTKCIDVRQHTYEAAINTNVTISPVSSYVVVSATNCAMICNADTNCQSFTICSQKIPDSFYCSLFDEIILENKALTHDNLCTYYMKLFDDLCCKYQYSLDSLFKL